MNKQLLVLALVATTLQSFAQDAPKKDPWQFSGFLDSYFGTASPYPGSGSTRTNRQFDTRNGSLRLSAAQLNIQYTDPKNRFGLTASPYIGDNSDILFSVDPSKSQWSHHLAQAFVTLNAPKGGITLDVGKFYSWIGYESAESAQSDLYSRGILYTLCQPINATGLRLTLPINAKFGASLYATEGWNQSTQKDKGGDLGLQLRYTPNAKLGYTLNFVSGKEGTVALTRAGSYGGIAYPNSGTSQTDMVDFIATYQATAKLKLAFNGDYASAHTGANRGKWSGASLVGRYQLTPKLAAAARVEIVNDKDGLRLGGTPSTVDSGSFELNYSLQPNTVLRVELRQDTSNSAIFKSHGGPVKHQSTVNFALNYRF